MSGMFRRKSTQSNSEPSPPSPPQPAPSLPPLTRSPAEQSVFSSINSDLTRSPSLGKAKVLESALPLSGFHRPSSATSPRAGGSLPKSPSMPTWSTSPGSASQIPLSPSATNFRTSPSLDEFSPRAGRADGGRRSIASLYPTTASTMNLLPKSPEKQFTPSIASSQMPKSASLPNVRRSQRVPPTLNVVVAGAARTGKTGFVRTLLGNAHLAGGANIVHEARGRVQGFGLGAQGVRRTREIGALTVDVSEDGERFSLTAIDTPGLIVGLGAEKKAEEEVERQLRDVLRMIEQRFEETLELENQVIRHSKRAHDHHLHLCIYFLDPLSITPRPAQTRSRIQIGAYANKLNGSPSKTNPNKSPDDRAPSPRTVTSPVEEEDAYELGMSEFDLKAIAKLQKRVNVLPVIGRADELTVSRLEEIKAIVKRDLRRAGISWGAFAPPEEGAISSGGTSGAEDGKSKRKSRSDSRKSASSAGHEPSAFPQTVEEASNALPQPEEEQEEHAPVPEEPVKLIRVRSRSRGALGRSASRRVLVQEESEEEDDDELRSNAEFLPFALVAPDEKPSNAAGAKFVREFKHGTLDVLNPDHTDFTLLRDALLSSVMKPLKDATRLDKYEPYRTQRLLARKAGLGVGVEQP